jgi:predicted AAA+ superfamily ATPase
MPRTSLTRDELYQRLQQDNPQWRDVKYLAVPDKRRLLYDELSHRVQHFVNRTLVVMGPRRVGKTTMLLQLLKEEIESHHVEALKTCYVSLDHPLYSGVLPEEILALVKERHGFETGGLFIFDEIQYLPDWARYLKWLHDRMPQDKFLVSGSAAAVLRLASKESGVGRFSDFWVKPLSFKEHVMLLGKESLLRAQAADYSPTELEDLNQVFEDYVYWGGLPEVVNDAFKRENVEHYVQADIVDKVVLKDIPSLFGIEDTRELNKLLSYLTLQTGQEVSIQSLSEKSNGIAKETIRKYLKYLEAAFLIHQMFRVDENSKRFVRETYFKVYAAIPALTSALGLALTTNPAQMGHLVETAILIQRMDQRWLQDVYYARWDKGEVDAVCTDPTGKPMGALEIKWSDSASTKVATQFCARNSLPLLWYTTKTIYKTQVLDGVEIRFEPAALVALRLADMPRLLNQADWTDWVREN